MSKFEINGIFKFEGAHGTHYMPHGLNLKDRLWWRYMPGDVINVAWPRGTIVVGPGSRQWSGNGPVHEEVYSADPNDHYRPWLEHYVGRQGWDWNWGMGGHDTAENRLTIKIRKKHLVYATHIAMMWS